MISSHDFEKSPAIARPAAIIIITNAFMVIMEDLGTMIKVRTADSLQSSAKDTIEGVA